MNDDQQSNYNLLYVQRQEQLLVEATRKTIDLEVRASLLSKALQDQRAEYENLQNQLEVQIDISNQACISVEDLTMKIKEFENKAQAYQEKIQVLESNYGNLTANKNEIQSSLGDCQTRLEEVNREFERQKGELQDLYNENVELKKLADEVQKPINKGKKAVDDSSF
jgi:chromosome segregation ATPase